MTTGLRVEMKGKLKRSLNLTAHVVSSYEAYIMQLVGSLMPTLRPAIDRDTW